MTAEGARDHEDQKKYENYIFHDGIVGGDSAALNERLSTECASNVTDFLEQNGILLTNTLAPGAMGTRLHLTPRQRVRPKTVGSWFKFCKTKG
jgi:hypothetical protein